MLEYVVYGLVPTALVAGVVWGKWQRKHRHIWTPWSRIWDEAKSELTKDQERFCKGCGLREEAITPACPPHDWGKWYEVTMTKRATDGRISFMGQQHDCLTCGYGETRSLTSI